MDESSLRSAFKRGYGVIAANNGKNNGILLKISNADAAGFIFIGYKRSTISGNGY